MWLCWLQMSSFLASLWRGMRQTWIFWWMGAKLPAVSPAVSPGWRKGTGKMRRAFHSLPSPKFGNVEIWGLKGFLTRLSWTPESLTLSLLLYWSRAPVSARRDTGWCKQGTGPSNIWQPGDYWRPRYQTFQVFHLQFAVAMVATCLSVRGRAICLVDEQKDFSKVISFAKWATSPPVLVNPQHPKRWRRLARDIAAAWPV